MTEKIIWIGGYPRVVGVNVPSIHIKKPAERATTQTLPSLSQNGSAAVSHDLRAGQATQPSHQNHLPDNCDNPSVDV